MKQKIRVKKFFEIFSLTCWTMTFQTFLDGKLSLKGFRQSKLSFVFEVGLEIISL